MTFLNFTKVIAHPTTTSSTWSEALIKKSGEAISEFELTKTLIFKSKTAVTAELTPVMVIALESTSIGTLSALVKDKGLKGIRLASADLLTEFFKSEKYFISPFAIKNLEEEQKDNIHVFIDTLLLKSDKLLAFHAEAFDKTVFIKVIELKGFLNENKITFTKLDFASVTVETKEATQIINNLPEPKKVDEGKEIVAKVGIDVKKDEDFSEWYRQVLKKSEMIQDYEGVSGCYIYRPWSYSVWKHITEISDLGVEPAYFPLFVTKLNLEKEKNHIERFAPEVAWITKTGSSDLDIPIAIRPTSEAIMYPYYADWIRSHRDLPLRLNQWNSVVRWEFKNALPFIRTREFLWQEGHSAFLTKSEADAEVMQILDLYRQIYEDLLAVPVIKGIKSEKEKFSGGLYTTTCESYIPSTGRSIQGATSHCLGQNFSKMFYIKVDDPNSVQDEEINESNLNLIQDEEIEELNFKAKDKETKKLDRKKAKQKDAKKLNVWQNSWGISTRSIGIMVMVHGDDKGLVMPPRVAAIQVVTIPCGLKVTSTKQDYIDVKKGVNDILEILKKAGIRAKADLSENCTSEYKFNHWEIRGVPLRLEVGPLDLVNQSTLSVRRDKDIKSSILVADLPTTIPQLLDTIHNDMYAKAKQVLDANVKQIYRWEDFVLALNNKSLILTPWCEEVICEESIKERSAKTKEVESQPEDEKVLSMGAKSLCIPFEQPTQNPIEVGITKCVACNNKAKRYALFGRSY